MWPIYIISFTDLIWEKSKAPEPPKKIYCAYWVRTGQCDFLQQGDSSSGYLQAYELLTRPEIGCKYKHEVNPTILNKFGMREIPKWYREKYGASSMKNGYNGNQKSEEKKLSNSASRNNGSADAGTASSRRVEQLHKWRHFAEKESGAAPPTTQGNVSKGPTTAVVGSKDLLTQDLLPSYTALNPAHSSTESVSRPRSATHQSAHAKSSQTTTQGQAKPSAPATPQKGQERPLTQGTTGSLNSSSNAAGSNGTGSIVSPTQHQARRQRSRRSVQTHVPSESPESSDSTHISGTTNNTGHIISNGSPNCKTPGVALPRLNIPSSRIIEKISSPDSSSHKRTRSILTREKSAADADKKAKSNPAKSGTSEKDEDSESAKSSPATPDETKPVAKGLKPGAATDVFGLGIYDN